VARRQHGHRYTWRWHDDNTSRGTLDGGTTTTRDTWRWHDDNTSSGTLDGGSTTIWLGLGGVEFNAPLDTISVISQRQHEYRYTWQWHDDNTSRVTLDGGSSGATLTSLVAPTMLQYVEPSRYWGEYWVTVIEPSRCLILIAQANSSASSHRCYDDTWNC